MLKKPLLLTSTEDKYRVPMQTHRISSKVTILLSLLLFAAIIYIPGAEMWFLNTQYSCYMFLDLQGLIAPLESIRAGLNPYTDGSFDPVGRAHTYGPFWLYLVGTGIDLKDTPWIGLLSVGIFLVIASITTSPKNKRELLLYILIVFSPPIVLAMTRMNNDIYVYLLVVLSSYLVAKNQNVVGCFVNLLSFGLKYYPILILLYPLGFIKNRKIKLLCVVGIVLTVIGLVMWWGLVYPGINKDLPSPTQIWTFAGPNIFRELGASPHNSRLLSVGLAVILAGILVARTPRSSDGVKLDANNMRYHLFVQSCILLLGATVLRESYAYRLVMVVGMLPYIWEYQGLQGQSQKNGTKLWLALTLVTLWIEWAWWAAYLPNAPIILEATGGQLPNETMSILMHLNFLKDIYYWIYFYITLKMFLEISNYQNLVGLWGVDKVALIVQRTYEGSRKQLELKK